LFNYCVVCTYMQIQLAHQINFVHVSNQVLYVALNKMEVAREHGRDLGKVVLVLSSSPFSYQPAIEARCATIASDGYVLEHKEHIYI
jgi:hypothetical protein